MFGREGYDPERLTKNHLVDCLAEKGMKPNPETYPWMSVQGSMDGCVDGWIDGWVDGGRVDRNVYVHGC